MVRKLCATALVWWGVTSSAHAQGFSVVGGGSTNDTGAAVPSAPPAGHHHAIAASGSHEDVHPHVESVREPWDYAGVAPGNNALAPGMGRRGRQHPRGHNQVAWPGFQMTPGGSRVFVAVTSLPSVTVDRRPGRIVYVLHGASVPVRNNRRALETEAFDTPVSRAFLRTHGGNAELVIELRGSVEPQMTTQPNATGLSYVFVDFPPWASQDRRDPPPVRPAARVPAPPGASAAPAVTPLPANGTDEETPPPIVR